MDESRLAMRYPGYIPVRIVSDPSRGIKNLSTKGTYADITQDIPGGIAIRPGATATLYSCRVPFVSTPQASKINVYDISSAFNTFKVIPDESTPDDSYMAEITPGTYSIVDIVNQIYQALNFRTEKYDLTSDNQLGLGWMCTYSTVSTTQLIQITGARNQLLASITQAYLDSDDGIIQPVQDDGALIIDDTGPISKFVRDETVENGVPYWFQDTHTWVPSNNAMSCVVNTGPSGNATKVKEVYIGVFEISGPTSPDPDDPATSLLIGMGVDASQDYVIYLDGESQVVWAGTTFAPGDKWTIEIDGDRLRFTLAQGTNTYTVVKSILTDTENYSPLNYINEAVAGCIMTGDSEVVGLNYYNTLVQRTTSLGTGAEIKWLQPDGVSPNPILSSILGFSGDLPVKTTNPFTWVADKPPAVYGQTSDIGVRLTLIGASTSIIGYSSGNKGGNDNLIGKGTLEQFTSSTTPTIQFPFPVLLNNKTDTIISGLKIQFVLGDGTILQISGTAEIWILINPN